jgi:hypothetical protein
MRFEIYTAMCTQVSAVWVVTMYVGISCLGSNNVRETSHG